MPDRQWPTMLAAELKRLRLRRSWTDARPVYVSVGLILTAAGLLVFLAGIIREPARPIPIGPPLRLETPEMLTGAHKDGSKPPELSGGIAVPTVKGVAVEEPASGKGREGPWTRPVAGAVGQAYGWQLHPVYNDWRFHPGLDFIVAEADRVVTVEGGKVTDVFEDARYGLTVVVAGSRYTVFYGSLADVKVTKNQSVARGELVGLTGKAPGEPYLHLHLAVRENDRYIDPEKLFDMSE